MNEKATILLVDDTENDIFLLRMAFRKAQFPAVLSEVRNGADAIAYLAGEPVAYRSGLLQSKVICDTSSSLL